MPALIWPGFGPARWIRWADLSWLCLADPDWVRLTDRTRLSSAERDTVIALGAFASACQKFGGSATAQGCRRVLLGASFERARELHAPF